MLSSLVFTLTIGLLLPAVSVFAPVEDSTKETISVSIDDSLRIVDFSGQFFFTYGSRSDASALDEFAIKRGYITLRSTLNNRWMIRFTQDISIDEEGDGAGDIELRMKYAYLGADIEDFAMFSSPHIQIGVVNRPWIDFEQDVNDYRAQREMFLDENTILSSADYGFTVSAGLGPQMEGSEYEGMRTNKGKFGSLAFGLYNGGGYSALENNQNKLVEGRFTLRPLPFVMPRFQVSAFSAFGKGNLESSPDFTIAGSAFSFESPLTNAFLQIFQSNGDAAGSRLDPETLEPVKLEGWSAFTEFRPLHRKEIPVSVVFRADHLLNADLDQTVRSQIMGGLGYVFRNRSKIIVDIRRFEQNGIRNTTMDWILEVRF